MTQANRMYSTPPTNTPISGATSPATSSPVPPASLPVAPLWHSAPAAVAPANLQDAIRAFPALQPPDERSLLPATM